MTAGSFSGWFTNYGAYNNLFHCMAHDKLWVTITVVLDFAVASGYIVIARHWYLNSRGLPDCPAKRALWAIRNIFVFCGLCGYTFIPIKMFWPAWRLYDLFMAVLVYYTWKYARGARDLKVVYNALGRTEKLAVELDEAREQANRKAFFLNAISHDLRTPLNGLMLQTEVAELAVSERDDALLRESLLEIRASAKVAADLLGYFLEIGKLDGSPEANKLTQVDVGELVDHVLKMNQSAAEGAGLFLKRATMATPAGDGDGDGDGHGSGTSNGNGGGGGGDDRVVARTDRLKVERILQNLVSNAIKFTRQGEVRVLVGATGDAGRDVEITVADTGVGIPAEHQQRLFEEFFQANNYARDCRKGFGLGLAIARRLAQHLGGELSFVSEPGAGSRFTLRLNNALVVCDGEHAAGARHQSRVAADGASAALACPA
jgi:signal transduction histidine kinase